MQSKAFLFALTTSFFWGLAPVFSKIGLVKPDPTVALAFRSLVISAILLFWAIATGPTPNLTFSQACLSVVGWVRLSRLAL